MPASHFRCVDGETILIDQCLKDGGCRMKERCATRSYLRLIGFDRKWDGVTPSSAGNGPRYLYLKATVDYVVDPNDRVWAALGTSTHDNLGMHRYNKDILSEEKLSDDKMRGIADCLEVDEKKDGYFILTDYKTWGSYKVAKSMGIVSEKIEETILDDEGKPVLLKTGKNAGKPKTKQRTIITTDVSQIDLRSEEFQLNRYRIFFEQYGFPVSRMQIQVVSRDGGTYIAKGRGIERNLYIIPIRRLKNDDVLNFYQVLHHEVLDAFKDRYARKCNMWESWEKRRCEGYCEVVEECKRMSADNNEKWGIV